MKLKEKEITILALHLGYGGVEKYISSLCRMLENDYKINIISTYKLFDKPAFFFSDKINITYLINDKPNKDEFKDAIKSKHLIKILYEGIRSIKILFLKKKRNIKAIKCIKSKYIITTREFHNSLVSKYANKEIVKIATEHNFHNNNNKYIHSLIKSLNQFHYLILVSNTLKNFYNDKTGDTKCIYIPNVIDNLPNKCTNLKENVLISIGRLEYEKAHEDLIDIVYEVKKEIKDIKLYLIGNGSKYQEIKDKIKILSLENNVVLTGFLSHDEMEEYLTKSKLFVMTSYTESFGLVLIESMSYKVPCIAFDSADGAKELLKDNNGVLVENRDKKKMANEIIRLLKNDKELKKISEKGYNNCKKYFVDNVKRKWLKLLNGEYCNEKEDL